MADPMIIGRDFENDNEIKVLHIDIPSHTLIKAKKKAIDKSLSLKDYIANLIEKDA